jgi:MFS family permease
MSGASLSHGRQMFFIVVICLSSFAYMHDMIVSPVIYDLFAALSDDPAGADLIVSCSSAFMAASMAASAWLMKKFSKKALLTVGLLVFAVAGASTTLFFNVAYICVMRSIVGAAAGIVATAALSLISEIFVDEDQRGTMIGVYNGTMSAIGALLSIVAGKMAASFGWMSVWQLYWVGIPIAICCMAGIPSARNTGGAAEVARKGNGGSRFPWMRLIGLVAPFLVFGTLYSIAYFQISVYIGEIGIGDQVFSGIAAAMGTAGSFLLCLFFGLFNRYFKHGVMVGCCFAIGCCYLCMFLVPCRPVALVAPFIIGGSFGLAYSLLIFEASTFVPEESVGTSIAICSAISTCSMFVSNFFVTFLRWILQTDTILGILPVLAAIGLAMGVVEVCIERYYRRARIGSYARVEQGEPT